MLRNFGPGGLQQNAGLPDVYRFFRDNYGDLVRMPGMFGKRDLLLSFHPNDYERLFRNEGQWPLRRGLDTFEYYRTQVRTDVFKGKGGLVSDQGENWQKFRTTVNPVMLQPKTVKLYVSKLDEVAHQLMAIMLTTRDIKNELPANFKQWINRWALESMGVLALDARLGLLDSEQSQEATIIVKYLQEFFELTYQLDVLPSVWKYYETPSFKRLMVVLDKITEIVIAKISEAVIRLEKNPTTSSESQSVLEKLLKVDRDIAFIMACDMLMAGVDTTGAGVTGILYCLASNPEKQATLRQELLKVLPRKDSTLTPENMHNLPYLRACIKESIRMCPPVSANVRATGRDLVLQGYQIPKGTDVAMSSMILQNDERFLTRANEFLPERWLKMDGYPSVKEAHPFLILPFGFGVRTCIGRRLAMLEMEISMLR
ncbi:probable cytochrome P450 12a5, mitochondrial [Armigeres subalbatus]|uniref:probable cytochrome P450 12a5, mitochondrial n=1 Tax=Armigeres subalbatus TaxID=124917 RepID=UPI002ED185E0